MVRVPFWVVQSKALQLFALCAYIKYIYVKYISLADPGRGGAPGARPTYGRGPLIFYV